MSTNASRDQNDLATEGFYGDYFLCASKEAKAFKENYPRK